MMLILRFLAGSLSSLTAQNPSCLFRRALHLTLDAVIGIDGLETLVGNIVLVDLFFF
jgi:hypothetical protein